MQNYQNQPAFTPQQHQHTHTDHTHGHHPHTNQHHANNQQVHNHTAHMANSLNQQHAAAAAVQANHRPMGAIPYQIPYATQQPTYPNYAMPFYNQYAVQQAMQAAQIQAAQYPHFQAIQRPPYIQGQAQPQQANPQWAAQQNAQPNAMRSTAVPHASNVATVSSNIQNMQISDPNAVQHQQHGVAGTPHSSSHFTHQAYPRPNYVNHQQMRIGNYPQAVYQTHGHQNQQPAPHWQPQHTPHQQPGLPRNAPQQHVPISQVATSSAQITVPPTMPIPDTGSQPSTNIAPPAPHVNQQFNYVRPSLPHPTPTQQQPKPRERKLALITDESGNPVDLSDVRKSTTSEAKVSQPASQAKSAGSPVSSATNKTDATTNSAALEFRNLVARVATDESTTNKKDSVEPTRASPDTKSVPCDITKPQVPAPEEGDKGDHQNSKKPSESLGTDPVPQSESKIANSTSSSTPSSTTGAPAIDTKSVDIIRDAQRDDKSHESSPIKQEAKPSSPADKVPVSAPQENGEIGSDGQSSPSSEATPIQEDSTHDGSIPSIVFENKSNISKQDSVESKPLLNNQSVKNDSVETSKPSHPVPVVKSDKEERKLPFSYSSEFLRELSSAPASLRKPSLPSTLDKSIILPTPRPLSNSHSEYSGRNSYAGGGADMLPNFISSGNNYGRNLPPRLQVQSRKSQQGQHPHLHPQHPNKQGNQGRKIITSTSLHQDVHLHQTGNAWKPQKMEQEASPDEQATIKLLKSTRGVLNKLTPDNFDKLSKKIEFDAVDTEDKMSRMLDLIFEKAIDEPAFCVQYSQLCLILSRHKIFKWNEEKKVDEEVKFFRLLLSKCQKEFESEVYDGIDLDARQEEIDNEKDLTQKKIKADAFDEEKRLARRRALGNIRLIGELYKLKMLKHSIMCGCVFRLVSLSSANPEMTDENMECLCGLLKTIGAGLEADIGTNRGLPTDDPKRAEADQSYNILSMAYEYMRKLTGDKEVQPRVRFMIQDVLDLKETGWRPRRSEAPKPTTVAEIHQRAAEEERRAIIEREEHLKRNKGRNQSDDGYRVQARKSQTAPTAKMNWDTLGSLKAGIESSLNSFGSGGSMFGPSQMSSWGQGSRGGSSHASESVNKYSALSSDQDDKKSGQSRDTSRNRDREDALNLVRNTMNNSVPARNFSRNSSVDKNSLPTSRNGSQRKSPSHVGGNRSGVGAGSASGGSSTASPSHKEKEKLSEDEAKAKCEDNVTCFLQEKDFEDALSFYERIVAQSNHLTVMNAILSRSQSISSQQDNYLLGTLLAKLVKTNTAYLNGLKQAFHDLAEYVEDIRIDVPKILDYFPDLLAPLFLELDSKSIIELLTELLTAFKSPQDVQHVFSKMIISSRIKAGQEQVVTQWKICAPTLTKLLNVEDLNNYFNQSGIGFLLDTPSTSSSGTRSSPTGEDGFREAVAAAIKGDSLNITNVIKTYYPDPSTRDSNFISALFESVVKACTLTGENVKFDSETFAKAAQELTQFVGDDNDKLVAALIGAEKVAIKLQHPSKYLHSVLEAMYAQNLVNGRTASAWTKIPESTLPGHLVAVGSVNSYITWIAETESDDEDDLEDGEITSP